MTFAVKLAVGAVLGTALSVAGLWIGSASADTEPPTTTVTTTTLPPISPEPAWIPDGGVRFASTVLIPQETEA
ncbi:MAG: hypothetical protein ABFS21_13005, partial [Actinomycetota bacterium]